MVEVITEDFEVAGGTCEEYRAVLNKGIRFSFSWISLTCMMAFLDRARLKDLTRKAIHRTGEWMWDDKDKPEGLSSTRVHHKDSFTWWVNSLAVGCITKLGKNSNYMFQAIKDKVQSHQLK
jgi:hypothetical protein